MSRGSAGGLSLAAVAILAYVVASVVGVSPPILVALKMAPAAILGVHTAISGGDRYSSWVSLGLLLSALGDGAIEWRFEAGIVVFLLAHVAYIAAFVLDTRTPRLGIGAIVGVLTGSYLAVVWPHVGSLRPAVATYVVVISVMMWRAWARLDASPRGRPSERYGAAGATAFGCSDSLLAWSRFVAPVPGDWFLVLGLYWLGQIGIAASTVKNHRSGLRSP